MLRTQTSITTVSGTPERRIRARIRRTSLVLFLAISALLGMFASSVPNAAAFTGHGCTVSTCRFFTSSYYTAKYFYDRTTCDQWKGLSKTYLQGFKTKTALHAKFPSRKLHSPC